MRGYAAGVGELMMSVVQEIREGTMTMREHRTDEGSYFGWPTVAEMRSFRRRGGRLA